MSLEEAILRKIKFGQTFCSYNFTPLSKSKNSTVIQIQRYCNSTSRSKHQRVPLTSTLRSQLPLYLQQKHKNINTTRPISSRQAPKQHCSQKIVLKKVLEEKEMRKKKQNLGVNKMNEYLLDYKNLKPDLGFKMNRFENVPRDLAIIDNKQCQQHSIKKISLKFAFDYQKFRNIQVHQPFNPNHFPQLFYHSPQSENNLSSPFVDFIIICINNSKYITEKTTRNLLFQKIPIKEYQQKLNNFSTSLEDNIFYLALGKCKNQEMCQPYTEGFFWIGKPIKHTERIKTIQIIRKFMLLCMKSCKQICECSIMQKIWIVDFNGKISYITRNEIQRNECVEISQAQAKRQTEILSKNVNENCFLMFLPNIIKGVFHNKIGEVTQMVYGH